MKENSFESSLQSNPDQQFNEMLDQIDVEIARARAHALTYERQQEIREEQYRLHAALTRPNAEKDMILKQLGDLEEEEKSARVLVATLPEFRYLLFQTVGLEGKSDVVGDFLDHENAHALAAAEHSLPHVYGVTFMKPRNGQLPYSAKVLVDIPEDMDPEERRRVIEYIAQAPERFENKLSDEDDEMLKHFKDTNNS